MSSSEQSLSGVVLVRDTPLQAAWAEFIAVIPWQWFVTFTFDPKRRSNPFVHPERALKAFHLWLGILSAAIYGGNWARKRAAGQGIFFVVGIEYHKSGVLHLHACLAAPTNLNSCIDRVAAMRLWEKLEGFARVEQPRSQQEVTRYVSKYVVKGGEIFHSPNLRDFLRQAEAVRPDYRARRVSDAELEALLLRVRGRAPRRLSAAERVDRMLAHYCVEQLQTQG